MSSNAEEKKPFEVGCCIGVPLLLIGIILSIPSMWILKAVQLFQEHRFRKKMQKQNRFIEWDNLASRLEQGQGTIILEGQNKMSSRVWWTEESIPSLQADSLPTGQELHEASMHYFFTTDETHSFVEWCFNRYLNPEDGSAYLTNAPRSIMKQIVGFDSAKLFKNEFPNIETIDTVRKT